MQQMNSQQLFLEIGFSQNYWLGFIYGSALMNDLLSLPLKYIVYLAELTCYIMTHKPYYSTYDITVKKKHY